MRLLIGASCFGSPVYKLLIDLAPSQTLPGLNGCRAAMVRA